MNMMQSTKFCAALAASSLVHLAVFAAAGTGSAPALVEGSRGEIHFGSPAALQTHAKRSEDTPVNNDQPVPDPKRPAVAPELLARPVVAPPRIESPLPARQPAFRKEITADRADSKIDPEVQPDSEPPEDGVEPEDTHALKETGSDEPADVSSGKTGNQPSDTPEETDGHKTTIQSALAQSSQRESALPGNADSSNYAGLVMRHLSKVRRPRAASPGSSFVSFTIGDDGELEDVRISKSSRSARFDRDALKVVRNAAPFPPPPAGVNRSFSVEIEGE